MSIDVYIIPRRLAPV